MNEQWRDDIKDTAYLLDAVARGDRTRVVKLLADYLLAEKSEDNESVESNTQAIEQDAGSDFQQFEDDLDDALLPRRRVQVVDVYGNEADEEEELVDGGTEPSYEEEYGFDDFQSHINNDDGLNDSYPQDQYYNDEYETALHEPYHTGFQEQRENQNRIDVNNVYDTFDQTQEHYNPYNNHDAYNSHMNYHTPADYDAHAHRFFDQAQDSQFYHAGSSNDYDHTSQPHLSEMEDYDPSYDGYYEDDPYVYYGSGALANPDQDNKVQIDGAMFDEFHFGPRDSPRSEQWHEQDQNCDTAESILNTTIDSSDIDTTVSDPNTGIISNSPSSRNSTATSRQGFEDYDVSQDAAFSSIIPDNEHYLPSTATTSDHREGPETENVDVVGYSQHHVFENLAHEDHNATEGTQWPWEHNQFTGDLKSEDLSWQSESGTTDTQRRSSLLCYDTNPNSDMRQLLAIWKLHRDQNECKEGTQQEGDSFRGIQRAEEGVNPVYNVFEEGTRFYDRYADFTATMIDSTHLSQPSNDAKEKKYRRWLPKTKWARLLQK